MSSREDILQSIRRATHVKYEKPNLKPLEGHALTYPNVVEQFYFIMKQVGGEAVFLEEGQDINELIRKSYPDAKRIASNLDGITCATFNPDNMEDPAELNGTDLAIVDGKIGVAENGAVWIEQDSLRQWQRVLRAMWSSRLRAFKLIPCSYRRMTSSLKEGVYSFGRIVLPLYPLRK